ncbi:UNVERIFIED_CONTAM: hypothetical protein Sangu_3069000 [Sesamum angustifolium]|uniref:Uncharacterized protein n=1 Tax=Sesamum angustifolium TaxID=2727405 RepID=A0AAW2KDY1_9LAMI
MNEVTEEFVTYFQTLLGGTRAQREINLDFLRLAINYCLSQEESNKLCDPITDSEIRDAMFDIAEDSAPGPDGYTSAFFKASWSVVGQKISAAIREFFRSGKILKQINATLLVLIPKVQMPSQVADYRPISCCNVIYKTITKLIVNWIQQVIIKEITSQVHYQSGSSESLRFGGMGFLLEALKLFNFPTRFISWIEQCVSTATFSVSLNGSTMVFSRLEVFVRVTQCHHTSLFLSWKLGTLCYDTEADINSIQVIKDTLSEFAALSGLKDKQQMIDVLGFQEGFLPVRYLGVPLISSRLKIADCKPLIDKLDSRIAGWSHLNLSFARRAQLIQSVLSTLHSYWASIFILPKGIIKILEAKLRKFLWQGATGRGQAKVAWDRVCQQKEEGGLGFRSILVMNKALMMKHLWKIVRQDRNSIWVAWILRHRLHNDSLWTFNGSIGSWGWKKLIKLRHVLKNRLIYQVGSGNLFKLWQDIWYEQGPLCFSYPRGPTITGLPLGSPLSSVLQHGQWHWPAQNDTEILEIMAHLPHVHQNTPDAITWRSSSVQFSVQSAIQLFQPRTNRVAWHGLLHSRKNSLQWKIGFLVGTMDVYYVTGSL